MNNNILMEPAGVDFLIGPSKMTKKDFQEISAYIKKHKKENLKSLITTNKKNKSKNKSQERNRP
jgi:hypothetical protein